MTDFVLDALDLHPDFTIKKFTIGNEAAPLLVIDNFVAQADELASWCALKSFGGNPGFFPGIRLSAPQMYQQVISEKLHSLLAEHFQLTCKAFKFSMCHYSLVTTPPKQLTIIQRIPHVDSFDKNGLATVHYLFRGDLGGTAFYRHRKTGYETVDETRKLAYFQSLEAENGGPNMPAAEYINGNTPLFEQIVKQDGVFNRMLVYRRNSLHSGCIDKNFRFDASPLTGRLSLNSFIDPVY